MYQMHIENLNLITQDDTLNEDERISRIVNIINQIEISHQLSMHGDLTFKSLEKICELKDKLNLNRNVREHLIWSYYNKLINEENAIDDYLLQRLIDEYQTEQSESILSILIKLIKQEKLEIYQIKEVTKYVKSPEINKKIFEYNIKNTVKIGYLIERDSIRKLFELRAYETLKFILDNGALTKEAYDEFIEPKHGETDKKWRNLLYQQANKHKNNEF
jgi:hypothetical protein